MSRRNTLVPLVLAALIALSISAVATAAPSPAPPFTLSLDNNIVVHKDAPNLQFNVLATNNTSTSTTCHLYVEELDYSSAPFELASNSDTGFGTAFPSTKRSTLTVDLVCGSDNITVATSSAKVTMTGQAGL